jgi:hypothetical protein
MTPPPIMLRRIDHNEHGTLLLLPGLADHGVGSACAGCAFQGTTTRNCPRQSNMLICVTALNADSEYKNCVLIRDDNEQDLENYYAGLVAAKFDEAANK